MNLTTTLPLAEIVWHCDGNPFRVRLSSQGPDAVSNEKVVFESMPDGPGGEWHRFEVDPSDEVFPEAAWVLRDEVWREFIGQLPPAWEDFLHQFNFARLEALAVLNECPVLLPHLEAAPALTAFVAAHVCLRGTDGPRWAEINAVYERGNIYAVLEWLGLPSSPQTLALLSDEPDPELPRPHLADYRRALWEAVSGHPLAA